MNKRELGIRVINDVAREFLLSPEQSSDLCELLLLEVLFQRGEKDGEYAQMKLNLLQREDDNFREALFEFERRLSGQSAIEA